MQSRIGTALAAHRRRLKRRGIARVEIRVAKADAGLIRRAAEALADPARADAARAALRQAALPEPKVDLKALLRAAPLEGIDLVRRRDLGRRVSL